MLRRLGLAKDCGRFDFMLYDGSEFFTGQKL